MSLFDRYPALLGAIFTLIMTCLMSATLTWLAYSLFPHLLGQNFLLLFAVVCLGGVSSAYIDLAAKHDESEHPVVASSNEG